MTHKIELLGVALLWLSVSYAQQSDRLEMAEITAQEQAVMPLALGVIKPSAQLKKISLLIKRDLEFTKQFSVDVTPTQPARTREHITVWLTQQYPLVIYLEEVRDSYLWRLYDTVDAHMIKGKKISKKGSWRATAHALADALWQALTGTEGSFSTKIVLSKKMQSRGRNCKRYLYLQEVTDVEGQTHELLVSVPTISICPRWNNNAEQPLILYSEYTKTNVRLVSVDLRRKRRLVSNFDGVNMQVTYNQDGSAVVYCLSQAPDNSFAWHRTSQLYYNTLDGDRRIFKRITTNQGNNFDPCWGPDNTIFYASDANITKLPNIGWLDLTNNINHWITRDSYATSPTYTPAFRQLAYTKMVKGKMQLWLYDLASQHHEQLTFDATDKGDCSWSPCGTMLVYAVQQGAQSRIAIFVLAMREQHFLTGAHEDCCYPAWSPRYNQFPML
jgi:TolB protein